MVAAIMVIIFLGFCCALSSFHVVHGEPRLDRESMPPHKHTIKTVQHAGDIFDCVDINKQPALDHPLLKNHEIQMRPVSFPEGITEEGTSTSTAPPIRVMDEECPTNTIPVMRVIKDGFMRLRSMPNYNTSNMSVRRTSTTATNDSSYATYVQMKRGMYYGTLTDLSVYGLPQVSTNQLSTSAIWIINDGDGFGPVEQDNSIMAGWTVNPGLFGDTHTRLFIQWTADGYQTTGCYNLLCPGFVQVNCEIPLGGIISPLSEPRKTRYVIKFLIFKDPCTQNWWMALGEDNKLVGYWPKSLFCCLMDHANMIQWGGMVSSPKTEKSPPMGSGLGIREGWTRACSFTRLRLVNKNNKYVEIPINKVNYIRDDNCYQGYDVSTVRDYVDVGQAITFGGPGGCHE